MSATDLQGREKRHAVAVKVEKTEGSRRRASSSSTKMPSERSSGEKSVSQVKAEPQSPGEEVEVKAEPQSPDSSSTHGKAADQSNDPAEKDYAQSNDQSNDQSKDRGVWQYGRDPIPSRSPERQEEDPQPPGLYKNLPYTPGGPPFAAPLAVPLAGTLAGPSAPAPSPPVCQGPPPSLNGVFNAFTKRRAPAARKDDWCNLPEKYGGPGPTWLTHCTKNGGQVDGFKIMLGDLDESHTREQTRGWLSSSMAKGPDSKQHDKEAYEKIGSINISGPSAKTTSGKSKAFPQ